MNLRTYLDEHVFRQPEYVRLQADFNRWYGFLTDNVEFHIQSEWHGTNHCGRVLLYALILADKLKLTAGLKEMLCHTAVFHDSRRFDDGLDVGHGERGADYYRDYCRNNGLAFYQESYLASFYHDLPDDIGLREIVQKTDHADKALFLYRLFKDADALDRYRLGLDGLDKRFLRFDESRNLTVFSKNLVLQTQDYVPNSINELKRLLNV